MGGRQAGSKVEKRVVNLGGGKVVWLSVLKVVMLIECWVVR